MPYFHDLCNFNSKCSQMSIKWRNNVMNCSLLHLYLNFEKIFFTENCMQKKPWYQKSDCIIKFDVLKYRLLVESVVVCYSIRKTIFAFKSYFSFFSFMIIIVAKNNVAISRCIVDFFNFNLIKKIKFRLFVL